MVWVAVERAALGHHVDLGEEREGLHGDDDQHQHGGVAQAGPGDVAEGLPGEAPSMAAAS